jgi:hypothetical protein
MEKNTKPIKELTKISLEYISSRISEELDLEKNQIKNTNTMEEKK